MKLLTWNQVNAWRLAHHGLAPRLPRLDLLDAVTRTLGIQAQVMSAAELALWARVDGLTPQDVQSALWQERSLVKTWAMRATLHLIAASEYPLYVAARSLHEARNWINYFDYFGFSPQQYAAFLAAVPQVLGTEPLTRQQLAAALTRHTGNPEFGKLLLSSSWGTPLKPSAWRGELCLGPNQGQNATYVHPGKWIGSWQAVEPLPAGQELLRRYLRAYGPSTPEDFARWWDGGAGILATRKLFKSMADELEPVEVEGWRAIALGATLEPMQAMQLSGTVNLLPLFDAYVMGLGRGRELEPLLPKEFQPQVFRPQGWISAVVLVDGYIKGVWEYKTLRSQTVVKLRLFSSPTPAIRSGIEAEAERLGAFLNSRVVLEYVDSLTPGPASPLPA